MTNPETIPVTVTPEAEARIAELGLQAAVDRMIDYARHHVPEVVQIEVVLYDRYEMGDQPGLAVDVYSKRPFDPAEHISWDLTGWVVNEFPSEVLEHIIMSYHPGAPYAG